MKIGLFVLSLLAYQFCSLLAPKAARADVFTYDMNATPGSFSTLTGTITFTGNSGDSAHVYNPNFIDLVWNSGGVFPTSEWDVSDVILFSTNSPAFSGVLGDAVLTPVAGSMLDANLFTSGSTSEQYGLHMQTNPDDWYVNGNGFLNPTVIDTGGSWDLTLASVVPAPSTFLGGLLGMKLLAGASFLRTRLVRLN